LKQYEDEEAQILQNYLQPLVEKQQKEKNIASKVLFEVNTLFKSITIFLRNM